MASWYPNKIFRWIASGIANAEVGVQNTGGGGLSDSEATNVHDERAIQISAVWACVRLISETVACLPLGFYRRTEVGREPLPENDSLVRLLKHRPNQVMTALEFREAMTMQVVLWGNGYARILRGSGGEVVSLIPLIPGQMDVIRTEAGAVEYRYYKNSGTEILAQSDIFHLKGISTEGLVGFSPLAFARQTLGLSIAAEQYSAGAFRRGGRPLGTVEFAKVLTESQRRVAHATFERMTSGAQNNARSWVLEGGAKYNPIGIPPDDLQMLETRKFQLGEIARFFRVPSHMINDSEKSSSWGTGIEQLNIGFLRHTLMPYLLRWESTIRNSVLHDRPDVTIEHTVEGLLRTDSKGRAEYYSKLAQNGIMTRNEIRAKENLAPMQGGDELTVQVNLTPLYELPTATGVTDDA